MKTLLAILVLASLTACTNPADTVSNTADQARNQQPPPGPTLVPVKIRQGVALSNLKLDHYDMEKVKLVKDELQISCTYGGGCEEHELDLLATRYVFDTNTAVVDLIVTHNANGDSCEAMIGSAHRFDLTPIKKAYAESAAAAAKLPIALRLFDFKGDKPVKSLNYESMK